MNTPHSTSQNQPHSTSDIAQTTLLRQAQNAKAASYILSTAKTAKKDAALRAMAEILSNRQQYMNEDYG